MLGQGISSAKASVATHPTSMLDQRRHGASSMTLSFIQTAAHVLTHDDRVSPASHLDVCVCVYI